MVPAGGSCGAWWVTGCSLCSSRLTGLRQPRAVTAKLRSRPHRSPGKMLSLGPQVYLLQLEAPSLPCPGPWRFCPAVPGAAGRQRSPRAGERAAVSWGGKWGGWPRAWGAPGTRGHTMGQGVSSSRRPASCPSPRVGQMQLHGHSELLAEAPSLSRRQVWLRGPRSAACQARGPRGEQEWPGGASCLQSPNTHGLNEDLRPRVQPINHLGCSRGGGWVGWVEVSLCFTSCHCSSLLVWLLQQD